MADFMKYVHFYIPFYWQSYYGAASTIAGNGIIVCSYDGVAVFIAMNIHKLEVMSNTFEAWVKIHSVERSKLDSQLLTIKGSMAKTKKIVDISFYSPQRDCLVLLLIFLNCLTRNITLFHSHRKKMF